MGWLLIESHSVKIRFWNVGKYSSKMLYNCIGYDKFKRLMQLSSSLLCYTAGIVYFSFCGLTHIFRVFWTIPMIAYMLTCILCYLMLWFVSLTTPVQPCAWHHTYTSFLLTLSEPCLHYTDKCYNSFSNVAKHFHSIVQDHIYDITLTCVMLHNLISDVKMNYLSPRLGWNIPDISSMSHGLNRW